jgi:hypothetical protein
MRATKSRDLHHWITLGTTASSPSRPIPNKHKSLLHLYISVNILGSRRDSWSLRCSRTFYVLNIKAPARVPTQAVAPSLGLLCLVGGWCLFLRHSSNFARRSFIFIFWWTYEFEDDAYVCSLLLERAQHSVASCLAPAVIWAPFCPHRHSASHGVHHHHLQTPFLSCYYTHTHIYIWYLLFFLHV